MELDVAKPGDVAGHSVIEADLGIGGRRLTVISGIALTRWQVDSGRVQRQECRLALRVPAGTLEQSSVHVGLASIANEDTDWLFATDQARLEVNDAGELDLITNLALQGEASSLHRFSYQVVVVTRTVSSQISGTIRWRRRLFTPDSSAPSAVAGQFQVMANLLTTVKGEGSFGGTFEKLTPVVPGQIVSVSVQDDYCLATYHIADPPKGKQLKVTVTVEGIAVPPGTGIAAAAVVPGTEVFTLTVANPSRTNVDFAVDTWRQPA